MSKTKDDHEFMQELGARQAWSVPGHREGYYLEGWLLEGYVFIVQAMGEEGFEVFAPVTDSNSFEETRQAIKARVGETK